MENKILIADTVPAINLPRHISQYFSYEIPRTMMSKLKKGSIVEIPFRNKFIYGVVTRIRKDRKSELKYELKRIHRAFSKNFYLDNKTLEMANFMSEYYYSPLSLVIKTITPKLPKKQARRKMEFNENISLEQISKETIASVIRSVKNKNLIIHNFGAEKHRLYLEIIKNFLQKDGVMLILFPEYFDVYNFAFFYTSGSGLKASEISVLTSEMTDNQYFEEWEKVASGSARLVIGTRSAVLSPFRNLKLIIVDNEHSSGFKQWDMNPRYSAATISEMLSSAWNSRIIFSSCAPSAERFHFAVNNGFSVIDLVSKNPHKTFEIVDMELERNKGNFSPLSEKLKTELVDSIYRKKQAIVFVPKLGISSITKCKDCEYMARCEDCSGLLTLFKDSLYCTRCRKIFAVLKNCPECGGQNISSFGYGIEKIEDEIRAIFKNKNIKISRLDSISVKNKSMQLNICKSFINGKIDIIIGTQMAIKNWAMPNLSIIAALFPEISFNQPDFKSREKSLQFLLSLKNEGSESRKIIIETFDSKNPMFKKALSDNLNAFYKEELLFRKGISKIGYPPFSHVIKLIYKNSDKEKGKREAERTYCALLEKLNSDPRLKSSFEIIKPFPAQSFCEHGKYRYYIIIKYALSASNKRDSILETIKKDWIIDIDPDSLL